MATKRRASDPPPEAEELEIVYTIEYRVAARDLLEADTANSVSEAMEMLRQYGAAEIVKVVPEVITVPVPRFS